MEGERRVRCNSLAGGGTGVQDHKRGFRGQGTTGGLVMRCEVGWSFEDFRFGGGMRLVELSQTTSQFIISPIRLLF